MWWTALPSHHRMQRRAPLSWLPTTTGPESSRSVPAPAVGVCEYETGDDHARRLMTSEADTTCNRCSPHPRCAAPDSRQLLRLLGFSSPLVPQSSRPQCCSARRLKRRTTLSMYPSRRRAAEPWSTPSRPSCPPFHRRLHLTKRNREIESVREKRRPTLTQGRVDR